MKGLVQVALLETDPATRLQCGQYQFIGPGKRFYPRTAPAVSPNAIFRCTSRKKMTTGMAVSVDAAMSAPQSVFRLVQRKIAFGLTSGAVRG